MADHLTVKVDDHGTARALELLGSRGLVKATRKGISNHVKLVKRAEQGEAPFNKGGISSRTFMKGGIPSGRVRITDYKLRFWAGGTKPRHTRRGFYRGFELADPFPSRVAAATDPLVDRHVDEAVSDAIRRTGLG